jgi:hypothetical protein
VRFVLAAQRVKSRALDLVARQAQWSEPLSQVDLVVAA